MYLVKVMIKVGKISNGSISLQEKTAVDDLILRGKVGVVVVVQIIGVATGVNIFWRCARGRKDM